MALTTYTELLASVALHLNRNDLTDALPDFVKLAESDMNSRLRCPQNEKRDTSFAVSDRFTNLPVDFAEMRRVVWVGSYRVELKPVAAEVASPYITASTPHSYAIHGNQLEVVPPQASTLELTYWRTLPNLADNNTNNVLARYPDLYLYGTCVQAALYLGDGNLVAKYQPLYERALSFANGQKQVGSGLAVRVA